MKSYALAIALTFAALYSSSQTYSSFEGIFGQPTQHISELSDVLYRATERFSVTPNIPDLFRGKINDVAWIIPAGSAPQTITIDLISKGELLDQGLVYPDGYVYISFYHTSIPQTITGRAKNKFNNWYDLINWTNISTSGGYAVWRGQMPSFNYMTALELTITPKVSVATSVSKIEFHRTRPEQNLQPAYVSKYSENKLHDNLSLANSNNLVTLKLKTDGGAFFDNSVGIGTSTPNSNAKLDVAGNIFSSGKVAIGTTDMSKIGSYALAVNGEAIFNKARVKLFNTWPDYVFRNDYRLMPLDELEKFIGKNKHLPEVPPESEVADKGIDLGEHQALLLKKIEELTLYLIEQKKEIDRQKQQLLKQQQEIERLKDSRRHNN